eukprot:gene8564-10554_t
MLLQEVMVLQKVWSVANTPAMARRGEIIRDEIPVHIHGLGDSIAAGLGIARGDFLVRGNDGVGNKSEIPWVRFGSEFHSPKTTVGWYLVFLFAGDGSACYLTLIQGSTTWNGQRFVA